MVRNQLTPTKAQMSAFPALYATEDTPPTQKVAVVRYFFGGRGAFYACEMNQDSGVMFGWCVSPQGSQFDEWGYMTLDSLKGIAPAHMVERDQYFRPKNVVDACTQNGEPAPQDF